MRSEFISKSAELWLRTRNVEAVACHLPPLNKEGFERVIEGIHVLWAYGNDGMAVSIVVDTEASLKWAGQYQELTQLAALGDFLLAYRDREKTDVERYV